MANNARTAADLERKYNFSSLLGLTKNIKMNEKSITKVQNELANMLNTLIINLKDVLDSQSEVSLWFYSGIPTTSNEPYISWTNPADHYGDIYYDQETGYVYQYSSSGWTKNTDTNLVQAMALTNVELDTTTDHERKVYFTEPSPPYSSGDWWILEDGTLKICQIGKITGEYEANDFIVSSKYVATVASKTGDTLTVLEGTVTEITKNYVKFTDLATGGSTVINGSNITTGTINTDNVTIGNGNVQMDEEGLKLSNGAKVIGENGLMNTYVYDNKGFIGYTSYDYIQEVGTKLNIIIEATIPEGLQITSAKVVLHHSPIHHNYYNPTTEKTAYYWGYSRNVKLYKANNFYNRIIESYSGSEFNEVSSCKYDEITGAFGTNGKTFSAASDTQHISEECTSIDIKNSFMENGKTVPGTHVFKIEPGVELATQTVAEALKRTGYLTSAMLVIDGYMSY